MFRLLRSCSKFEPLPHVHSLQPQTCTTPPPRTSRCCLPPWTPLSKQVQKADYHWVWLPLKPEVRAHFNGSAAAAVLAQHLGTPYGTQNMYVSCMFRRQFITLYSSKMENVQFFLIF